MRRSSKGARRDGLALSNARFWDRAHAANKGPARIALLLEMADVIAWDRRVRDHQEDHIRKVTRADFNTEKQDWRGHAVIGACWACGRRRERVWHHIIQLQNGGSNRSKNTVRVCHECHAQIHPWLPMPRDTDEALYREARRVMAARHDAAKAERLRPRLVRVPRAAVAV